nr:MAG TPA: hypothetical protein [Caudoviricetes sp.]
MTSQNDLILSPILYQENSLFLSSGNISPSYLEYIIRSGTNDSCTNSR